jgi:ketosteroid isomerase-like protein
MRTMRVAAAMWLAAMALPAADWKSELMEADRAFSRATAERGLDGWMSWFAEDAQVNAAGGAVRGREALRAHYAKMFSQPGFSIRWAPYFAEASADGTLGYTLGTATIASRAADGTLKEQQGRYLTVWRRGRDGRWSVVTDLGN